MWLLESHKLLRTIKYRKIPVLYREEKTFWDYERKLMSKKRYRAPSIFTNVSGDDKINLIREQMNSPEYLDKAISEIAITLTNGILNPYIADKESRSFEG